MYDGTFCYLDTYPKANGKFAVQMAKCFQHHLTKQFHIFKWIFFAISTSAIMEKIASAVFEKCY